MGRYFFSGGLMPSDDWFLHLQSDLVCVDHWQLSGEHYEKTANAWIDRHHAHRREILGVLTEDLGGGRSGDGAKYRSNNKIENKNLNQ